MCDLKQFDVNVFWPRTDQLSYISKRLSSSVTNPYIVIQLIGLYTAWFSLFLSLSLLLVMYWVIWRLSVCTIIFWRTCMNPGIQLMQLEAVSFLIIGPVWAPGCNAPSIHLLISALCISIACLRRMLPHIPFFFIYVYVLHACVGMWDGEVGLVGLKSILRTTTSFSALTLSVGSFDP